MLLARVGVLNGGGFSRCEAVRASSGLPPDTRHNTSTWDGRRVRGISQESTRHERSISHLEDLEQHVSPRALAERLVVHTAVIGAALVRVWLHK